MAKGDVVRAGPGCATPESIKGEVEKLYCEYLSELMSIQGALPGQGTFGERFRALWDAEDTSWHFIYEGDRLVGFMATGHFPNCHPAADHYIEDAYITPPYRGRELMKEALFSHMKEFGGSVYCLFVLTKNTAAARFWDHVFALAGYEPWPLSEVGRPEPLLVQKGYREKWKKRKGWAL